MNAPEDLDRLLSRYLDGDLDGSERTALEARLGSDAAARERLAELLRVHAVLGRLHTGAASRRKLVTGAVRSRGRRIAGAAAFACVAIAIAGFVRLTGDSSGRRLGGRGQGAGGPDGTAGFHLSAHVADLITELRAAGHAGGAEAVDRDALRRLARHAGPALRARLTPEQRTLLAIWGAARGMDTPSPSADEADDLITALLLIWSSSEGSASDRRLVLLSLASAVPDRAAMIIRDLLRVERDIAVIESAWRILVGEGLLTTSDIIAAADTAAVAGQWGIFEVQIGALFRRDDPAASAFLEELWAHRRFALGGAALGFLATERLKRSAAALPELEEVATLHPDALARVSVLATLLKQGEARFVDALAAEAGSAETRVRFLVATHLRRYGASAHVPALLRLIADPDEHVRQRAASALEQIRSGSVPSDSRANR